MDTPSDQLAQSIPGFAGAYVDGGALNVLLTDDVIGSDQSKASAQTAVAELLRSLGRDQMPVKFHPAKYSFLQLRKWESVLREMYPKLGVDRAGIDERNNRLDMVLSDQGNVTALAGQLAGLAIPTDAITSRIGARGSPYTTLLDKVRPTRGGLFRSSAELCVNRFWV